MASPDKLKQLQAQKQAYESEVADDAPETIETPDGGAPVARNLLDDGFVRYQEEQDEIKRLKQELNAPKEEVQEPTQKVDIAEIERQVAERERAKYESDVARLQSEANERLTAREKELQAERDAQLAELEDFRQAKRVSETKVSPEEWQGLIEKYGEDEAKERRTRIEADRQYRYDIEKKLEKLEKQSQAPVQKTIEQRKPLDDGYSDDVETINSSFNGFNKIATESGHGLWNDFVTSDKFKEVQKDSEFAGLFKRAFKVEKGVIASVDPILAKVAEKRLAELVGTKAPARAPLPSRQSQVVVEPQGKTKEEDKPQLSLRQIRAQMKAGKSPSQLRH